MTMAVSERMELEQVKILAAQLEERVKALEAVVADMKAYTVAVAATLEQWRGVINANADRPGPTPPRQVNGRRG